MANRRMFSLDVINTDKFMDMPLTAQALYFHLGMRADDDGFIAAPKQIMKAVECKQDDMKILITKGYVIPFESGIVVIRHWKQHNYIQSDRYRKTKFSEERSHLELMENVYMTDTECIQNVSNMEAQYRLSKDIVRVRDRDSIELGNTLCSEPDEPAPNPSGILLSLNDKSVYDVPLDKISTWQQAYPAVNVNQELQKMRAWLDSNPSRRKTRKGIDRFINTWLSKEQDKGGIYRNGERQQSCARQEYEYSPEYQELYKSLGKNKGSKEGDPFE